MFAVGTSSGAPRSGFMSLRVLIVGVVSLHIGALPRSGCAPSFQHFSMFPCFARLLLGRVVFCVVVLSIEAVAEAP